AGLSAASRHRWASTVVMGVYSLFWAGMLWILPLFPATPKLGPVYHNVTHFIPMPFPLLLIVPAVALDLVRPRIVSWAKWLKGVAGGLVFLVSFIAAQWPFADFLMTPAARNRVFGTHYFPYADPAGILYDPFRFHSHETRAQFWIGMAVALAISMVATRIGLAWGDWMQRIRR
ncbi:MAG TPA: hypothetical protein VJV74_13175, partial [Terriglobia bacterium]|nr:hypothetical protein [Terriglobia bacterium]